MARRRKTRTSLKSWILPAIITGAIFLAPQAWDFNLAWLFESRQSNLVYRAADLPIIKANMSLPRVLARHIFIMDRASKVVLWERNSKAQIFPASTTKMMTALVSLEAFPLDRVITVTRSYPIGQFVGFKPGDKLSINQLLYALLIQSGNDAAEILAENYTGGRAAFIDAMNKKVFELHLLNTHFVNPSGIDEDGHYSSAQDLARLADITMQNPEFAKIVAIENAVLTTESHQDYVVKNVNQLLGKVPGVLGVKTGFTTGAGQSLVTLVTRNGHEIILAVLGSVDRFADTQALIDWAYSSFTWLPLDPHNPDLSLVHRP